MPCSAHLQRGHGGPGAAFARLTVPKGVDERVGGEEVAHRLAKGARALAVDQSNARQAREERVVEVLLDGVAGLVGRSPQQQQLGDDFAGGRGRLLCSERHSHGGRPRPPLTLAVTSYWRSEEHTSELQSPCNLVCRLLLE